jgi:heterodisulfide reductase subunit A-like polyferredoxin
VASLLGLEAVKKDPRVAFIRCNGTCDHRPKTSHFDGATTCAIAASVYSGESDCQFGCLGFGDCYDACDFGAIDLRANLGVPLILDDKCVACGACVVACPKKSNRTQKKISKRPESGCCLPERRERRHSPQGLRCGLYRVRQMRKGM